MVSFITFEGGEGSGKTTQSNLLYKAILKSGEEALLTREPGGTENAELIRNLIMTKSNKPFSGITELLLINAARYEHVTDLIKPSLKSGKIVICDRFADSTMAYQGYAQRVGRQLPAMLHNLLMQSVVPNLTFILDVEPFVGLERAKSRGGNKYEEMNSMFHEEVRKAFLEIAKQAPNRCILLDSTKKSKEETHHLIVQTSNKILGLNIKELESSEIIA